MGLTCAGSTMLSQKGGRLLHWVAKRMHQHCIGKLIDETLQAKNVVVVLGQIAVAPATQAYQPHQGPIDAHRFEPRGLRKETVSTNVARALETTPEHLFNSFRRVEVVVQPIAMRPLNSLNLTRIPA